MRLSHILRLTLLYLFSTIFSNPYYAQEYLANLEYYGIEEGLSHREVYDIHKDKNGFIWVGTKYGLNRFDGYEFKWYTKEKNGLGSNTVHHIVEDAAENLWLFESFNWYYLDNIQSLSILDLRTNTIQTFEEKFGEEAPISIDEISYVVTSPNGTLYMGLVNKGLISYHPQKGWKFCLAKGDIFFEPRLYTKEHTIWGLSDNFQVLEIDTLGNVLRTLDLPSHVDIEDKAKFKFSHIDKEGNLWIHIILSVWPHLLKIDLNSPQLQIKNYGGRKFETIDPFSEFFYHEEMGAFWYKGLPEFKVWRPEEGTVFDFTSLSSSLFPGDIHDIFFDESDRAWVSSFYGLYQIKLKTSPFQRYFYHNNFEVPSGDLFSCRGIWADSSHILINTYKGPQYINHEGENHISIPEIAMADKTLEPNRYLVLPHAILKDRQGVFWFGEAGLVRMDSINGSTQVFPYANHAQDDIGGYIWSLFEDERGKIWIGTERGIGFLDKTSKVCRALNVPEPFSALNASKINVFTQIQNGNLLLGTSSGLYEFHPEKGVLNRFWTGGTDNYRLPSDDIRHLYQDEEGYIWLATYGEGLLKLSIDSSTIESGKHYEQYTLADGLSNNNLYAVYEDDYNHLWMSSDFGIIVFNKETFQSQAFLPQDGITHQEFNTISHFQAEDGRIYFGSLNGLTAFYPHEVLELEQPFDASLVVRGLQQFDQDQRKIIDKSQEFAMEGQILLRPGERFFELKFALLTYQNVDKIRYRYRIDDLQDNWTYTHEPYIRFSGLTYGNHTLYIHAQGPDGRHSSQSLEIPIYVQPPIYLSKWFIGGCVAVLILLIITVYRRRTYLFEKRQQELKEAVEQGTLIIRQQNDRLKKDKDTIEQQAEELRRLDKVKSRFFANISHELRTPLTLLLGPINRLVKKGHIPEKDISLLKLAQKNGQELLQLINQIMELSKLEANKLKLEPQTVNFYPFVRQIIASFEALAQMKKLTFTLQYRANPRLHLALDENKFQRIINNILANAFKYTAEGGQVDLIIEDDIQDIRISLKDSGRGIHPDDLPHIFDRFFQSNQEHMPAEGGTGIGLALAKELITLMEGKIWVESEWGKGSIFYISFPKKEVVGVSPNSTASKPSIEETPPSLEHLPTSTDLITQQTTQQIILLVEDNQDIQKYISSILEDKYQVICADNGKKALEIMGDFPPSSTETALIPSLIISDIMMPVMDGFQFLDIIKNHTQYSKIPVIMLTAKAGMQHKMKALRMGVDDYILKPFEEEELLVRIENLLTHATSRLTIAENPNIESNDHQDKHLDELSTVDTEWLEGQEQLLIDNVGNSQFNINQWAETANMSERNLQRKLKQLTGLSPYQYMMEIRLNEGRRLLEIKAHHSLAEVAYAVGFSNPRSFSRNFKRRFGKSPSSYN